MSCNQFKILALTEEIVKLNEKITLIESTIAECKAKNIDPRLFIDELDMKKKWKSSCLETIETEEKKCQLLKLLQTSIQH